MSPKSKKAKPIDIYVRVSRVGGREGESYLSPQLQEERCRAMITVAGAEVGQVFVDEDVSGRKMSRPAFDRAMQRVRHGRSGGICVWKLSRFGRSTQGVLRGVQELEKHGAVLMSTSEALDTSTSVGRFVLTIFAALAELESEQIRESWDATHDSMISRGIHSGAHVPVGYRKGEDKRLVPNEDATYVREAFRMRAEDGTSWREIARYLTERDVPTISGRPWSPSSARTVIRNRVYLGEARHGNRVKVDAHAALVDARTFRLANRRHRSMTGPPTGFLLGGGIVRCSVDSAAMVRGVHTSEGRRYEFLRCRLGRGGHPTISFSRIKPYVRSTFNKRMLEIPGSGIELLKPSWEKIVTHEADPELLQRLENVLVEIAELDRQLEAGELPPSIYSKAMTVAERDREGVETEIAQAPSSGDLRFAVEEDALRFDALNALCDLETPVDPELVPAARDLLREELGVIVVHPGRGPVEQRVTFEPV